MLYVPQVVRQVVEGGIRKWEMMFFASRKAWLQTMLFERQGVRPLTEEHTRCDRPRFAHERFPRPLPGNGLPQVPTTTAVLVPTTTAVLEAVGPTHARFRSRITYYCDPR